MDLIEFKNHILAERMAEIKEKRNNNLKAMMSVANATISNNNERKEN